MLNQMMSLLRAHATEAHPPTTPPRELLATCAEAEAAAREAPVVRAFCRAGQSLEVCVRGWKGGRRAAAAAAAPGVGGGGGGPTAVTHGSLGRAATVGRRGGGGRPRAGAGGDCTGISTPHAVMAVSECRHMHIRIPQGRAPGVPAPVLLAFARAYILGGMSICIRVCGHARIRIRRGRRRAGRRRGGVGGPPRDAAQVRPVPVRVDEPPLRVRGAQCACACPVLAARPFDTCATRMRHVTECMRICISRIGRVDFRICVTRMRVS